jgi:hypothetical protein
MATRRQVPLLVAALALTARSAAAAPGLGLYQGRTIVTGEREETRLPGVRACFADVLVKVSGDRRLLDDPRAQSLLQSAPAFVTHFETRDRMAGRPIRDEQGTRDRPYDLTVDFDPVRIDALLAGLGRRPWPAPRPRLVIFLGVRDTKRSYVLAEGGDFGSLQREAFLDASVKFGVPIAFPGTSALDAADLSFASLAAADPTLLLDLARRAGGRQPLRGSLIWDSAALGWAARWQLNHGGRDHAWGVAGVNFDAAFRDAIGGAAQVLSGNGEP